MAPSYSRGRDETSRTEADAPLEPAPPNFAYSASKETKTIEPTFGLRGEMDKFHRLKAMYPDASSRELAEFQVFAKAMATHREDGRGSEAAVETIMETLVTTSGGAGTALARTSRTPASATSEMELLRDPGGMRRVVVPTLALIPLVATTDVTATGVG